MRRLACIALLAGIAFTLLPAAPAVAACAAPPGRSSPEGRQRIRSHALIVYGTIGGDVPRDAHGVYSLFFDVRRYYTGSGPRRIEITNYGDLDLFDGYEDPGNRRSLSQSVEFLRRFAGQAAVFFLTPHDDALGRDAQERYKDEYATTSCTYNVVGNQDAPVLLRLLQAIFSSQAPPPGPGATTSPSAGGASPVPTGSLGPAAAAAGEVEPDRGGPITRAAGLVILVALGLLLYRSPRSPLFERWR